MQDMSKVRIGLRVVALRDFVHVPKGTEGVIVDSYTRQGWGDGGAIGYDIAWQLPHNQLVDGFSESEVRDFLEIAS